MNEKIFAVGTVFESDTVYRADRAVYDIYPSDSFEEIPCWWTFLNSGNIPLRAAFVLRGLKNVTIDLGGAKLLFHGRIMPFALYGCENVTLSNFSIDYDRPFYTQGTVVGYEAGSVDIEIPELFRYRIEGRDFIALSDTWEHRLITGDMLLRCMDAETGKPSHHSGVILGLIGGEIFPRPNPPLPIHHLYAEDLGGRRVRISGLPDFFVPRVGEILAMTHEDRRKTGFLLEHCADTVIRHVRLMHIGAMGITAGMCHNISLDDYSMYMDESTPDRIISINADSFHCYHCTGLMKVENCRFESMLDDAINIHGNYLVVTGSDGDGRRVMAQNRCAGLLRMEFLAPGDEAYIYRGSTQELRCSGIVESAEYTDDKGHVDIAVTFRDGLNTLPQPGDIIENRRMPEIEVRNCSMKCSGGFRISSGKRVLIEDCDFETSSFAVLFSGDMNYWYENGPVKDVTIRGCRFRDCGSVISTACGFTPTEAAPYYHENIRFIGNDVCSSRGSVISLSDVRGFEYRGNRINGVSLDELLSLTRCADVCIS